MLLTTVAFCSSSSTIDLLNDFDKSTEGKKFLDGLYLQTKLMGANLKVANLKAFLKGTESEITSLRKASKQRFEASSKMCQKHWTALNRCHHAQSTTCVVIDRHLSAAKKLAKAKKQLLHCQNSEKTIYEHLATYCEEDMKGWDAVIKALRDTHTKCKHLISAIHNHVSTHTKKGAFVEIDNETSTSYITGLSQIRADFESTFEDFDGLRPVIANLLEIMSNSKNLMNTNIAHGIIVACENLANIIREKEDEIEEINESQSATFINLRKVYEENASRTDRVITALEGGLKLLSNKEDVMNDQVKICDDFVKRSGHIIHLRKQECQDQHAAYEFENVSIAKIEGLAEQLHEILAENWPNVKSFFLQRAIRNKN